MNMSRKIENVRFPSEMSHHRELSPVCGIRLEMIHFFADSVSNVTEVLSQIQTKLSPDAFFRHLSVQAKQQLFCGKSNKLSHYRRFSQHVTQHDDSASVYPCADCAGASNADYY